MDRRSFLKAALLACSSLCRPVVAEASTNYVVGAIRWDAWDAGAGSYEQVPVQASLGPSKWQGRAPWFAKPVSPNAISIDGSQQATMDAEIAYAKNAGLNYWAYCWYGPTDIYMQKAWALQQSSSIKNQVNWCMILQFSRIGNASSFGALRSTYASYFQQANYQKVLSGRPLLYLFIDSLAFLTTNWGGSWSNVQTALNQLRTACTNAGLANPYIVIMYGTPTTAQSIMIQVSGDAISNYTGATQSAVPATAYIANDTATQAFWARMAATGAPIVPICQTGWDTRPRKQNPPPWMTSQKSLIGMSSYVAPGTPAQIAADIQAAITFVANNTSACPSKTILIYSWNECDEGGGALVPTFSASGPVTATLNAVANVLTAN